MSPILPFLFPFLLLEEGGWMWCLPDPWLQPHALPFCLESAMVYCSCFPGEVGKLEKYRISTRNEGDATCLLPFQAKNALVVLI